MHHFTFYLHTLPLHIRHLICAFSAYEAVYLVISPAVSRLVAGKSYSTLDTRTKINWNIRVVSFIQSIFICCCAVAVILTEPDRRNADSKERLWAYTKSSGTVQAFAAGYFLWDVMICLQHLDVNGPSALVHAICAFGITMLGFRPFANYYGVNFVLYELSTPFLNIHWFLDKTQLTGSRYQLINGLCLISTFASCRLFWGVLQTWRLFQDIYFAWGSEWTVPNCRLSHSSTQAQETWNQNSLHCGLQAFPTTLVSIYLLSNSVLTFLNFMWFGKMLKALQKRLK